MLKVSCERLIYDSDSDDAISVDGLKSCLNVVMKFNSHCAMLTKQSCVSCFLLLLLAGKTVL